MFYQERATVTMNIAVDMSFMSSGKRKTLNRRIICRENSGALKKIRRPPGVFTQSIIFARV